MLPPHRLQTVLNNGIKMTIVNGNSGIIESLIGINTPLNIRYQSYNVFAFTSLNVFVKP